MPSRYRRARMDAGDPRIAIRARYMEAIRAGANIAEATAYANGAAPVFTKTATVEETAPEVTKHRLAPTPGERELLLPGKVVGELPPPLPAVDPEVESIKRPMTAPVSVAAPVSANAEKAVPTGKITRMKPPLPADWDSKDTPWPQLRGFAMAMGLPTPNSRGDAIKAIKAKLDADVAPAEPVAA